MYKNFNQVLFFKVGSNFILVGQHYYITVGLIEFLKREFKENVLKQKILKFFFLLQYKKERHVFIIFLLIFFFYNISFLTYNLINIS